MGPGVKGRGRWFGFRKRQAFFFSSGFSGPDQRNDGRSDGLGKVRPSRHDRGQFGVILRRKRQTSRRVASAGFRKSLSRNGLRVFGQGFDSPWG